jgi:hypothetical protein
LTLTGLLMEGVSPPLLNASQLYEMGLHGFHLDVMLAASWIRNPRSIFDSSVQKALKCK